MITLELEEMTTWV